MVIDPRECPRCGAITSSNGKHFTAKGLQDHMASCLGDFEYDDEDESVANFIDIEDDWEGELDD